VGSRENSLTRYVTVCTFGILRLRACQPFQYEIYAALRSGRQVLKYIFGTSELVR
jgi:hypothetical protein